MANLALNIVILMPTWRTKISLRHSTGTVETSEIYFRNGIFQGDSLSPLLFCIALIPLSNILDREKIGYRIWKRVVSNLLYIDDLKIYTRSKETMKRVKELVQKFSQDISMEFGLDKCAVIHVEKGKIVNSAIVEDIPLLTGDPSEPSYKYLGVLQTESTHHQASIQKASDEYCYRVRKILRSHLIAQNTSLAIKSFALPVLRYTFDVLQW